MSSQFSNCGRNLALISDQALFHLQTMIETYVNHEMEQNVPGVHETLNHPSFVQLKLIREKRNGKLD